MNVKDTGDYNLVYLFGDSARWPWHLSSTKNVDMKMINWLGSIPSVIDDWKQTEKASQILGGGGNRALSSCFSKPHLKFSVYSCDKPFKH